MVVAQVGDHLDEDTLDVAVVAVECYAAISTDAISPMKQDGATSVVEAPYGEKYVPVLRSVLLVVVDVHA